MGKRTPVPWLDGYKIEHQKKRAFLVAFAECGNVSAACDAAEIGRGAHYDWIKKDKSYAEAFEDARERAADSLEQEARRRAREGVERPVYQGGKLVGEVTEYSDVLLIFLLKGLRPEKYRDRQSVEHSGKLTLEDLVAGSNEPPKEKP